MSETATLNVRMDVQTKDEFLSFCDEVGVSASALMNMFAKNVIRNQRVPFSLTTQSTSYGSERYARIFPANEEELDEMLAEAESVPLSQCIPASEGFASIERHFGW